MTKIVEVILGRKRVQINENNRALYLNKGQIKGILRPGEHTLDNRNNSLELEMHSLHHPEFLSDFEKPLFDKYPDVATEHLTVFKTGSNEIAVIEKEGQIHSVLRPDKKLVVWKDAGPWSHQVFDLDKGIVLDSTLLQRLSTSGNLDLVTMVVVNEGHVVLLNIDGLLHQKLEAGAHGFWTPGRIVLQKQIDLRQQSLDVTGQELLTRDRVTIRVNITANYRVADPVKAVSTVKDFNDTLYRALQHAFRKALGALTLDQILKEKVLVDEDAAAKVKAEMAEIGVEVGDIMLKDVILPGEMRDILNTVVTAEKEAEANVIRRREETNATRSLLNTAKVMAQNPVMLRLKELEALEVIASKVERLTIHNGTAGLLNDVVRLSDD